MEDRPWSFLTNHGTALLYIARQPQATLREIADAIGITERATTRIVKDLRRAGYVTATREGRRNSYVLNLEAPIRHPVTAGQPVRVFVEALNGAPATGDHAARPASAAPAAAGDERLRPIGGSR